MDLEPMVDSGWRSHRISEALGYMIPDFFFPLFKKKKKSHYVALTCLDLCTNGLP